MTDLIERIKAAIDEDEAWALAASQPYEFADPGSKAPEGGAHWQWVTGEDWDPVTPNPMHSQFVAEPGQNCRIVSKETWQVTTVITNEPYVTSTRQAEKIYSNDIIEFDSGAAGHIIRHDPARVLRQVTAHRKLLAKHPHNRFQEPLKADSPFEDDRRQAFAEDPKYIGCMSCNWDHRYDEAFPSWWCEPLLDLAAIYEITPDPA